MIQMFNHGINVIGLWIVADAIEQQLGTRKFSELGGLAQKAPTLAILFVVMAFANISLPLTNAFVGEFLMFNGLFQYNHYCGSHRSYQYYTGSRIHFKYGAKNILWRNVGCGGRCGRQPLKHKPGAGNTGDCYIYYLVFIRNLCCN